MKTKGFVILLAVVLALGGSLGGAFAGGLAIGKSRGEEAARRTLPSQSATGIRQQMQGQLNQQQMDQMRQQLQGQDGQGGRTGFMGGGGLTGTIESIQGNTVTVNTAQGPLQATISADTTIQMMAEGSLKDLTVGLRVTVTGQRGEDGTVIARSILVTPEGSDSLFGGGLPFGDRQPQGQQ